MEPINEELDNSTVLARTLWSIIRYILECLVLLENLLDLIAWN
jgi:hypothetical protein